MPKYNVEVSVDSRRHIEAFSSLVGTPDLNVIIEQGRAEASKKPVIW